MISPLILIHIAQSNAGTTVTIPIGKPLPGQLWRLKHWAFSNLSGEAVTFRPVLQLQEGKLYCTNGYAVATGAASSNLTDMLVGEGQQLNVEATGSALTGAIAVQITGELIQADPPAAA